MFMSNAASPRTTLKPWSGEFPVDSAEDTDDAAIRILARNMAAGRRDDASSFSPNGIPHQAIWDRAKR